MNFEQHLRYSSPHLRARGTLTLLISALPSAHYKAQLTDIERMLRDATADRWDSQPFDRVLLKETFHPSSLRWYRDRFHQVNAGFDPKQPDQEFLYHWGYLLRDGKRFIPIRGAIMLFGSPLAVHQLIPRPTLDFQFLGYATDEPMPETRWIDRIVCEENIIQAWDQLVSKYKFFMPKPFKDIDPVTLGRRDDPPGFRVFREAAVNLLIHQDYGDHSRKAVIKFFRDGIQFWNPGDVFGDDSRLLEPGEKEVRNPVIATAMRRIAMCEQAGTGMRMMREAWQALGHPAPVYKNERAWKAFELFIPELDKEVDMASALMKAMFGNAHRDGAKAELSTGEVAGEVTGEVTDQDNRQVPDKHPTSHLARILGLEGCRESFFKIRPSTSLGPPKSGAFYGFGFKTPSHQWPVGDDHPG